MLGLLRYATARPRLAASIVGQLGRDVGLAESGLPRVKRDALLTGACPTMPRPESLRCSGGRSRGLFRLVVTRLRRIHFL
jgi:hypothetical protein